MTNLTAINPRPTPVNREARNALFGALAVFLIALLSLSSVVILALTSSASPSWRVVAEILTLTGLLLASVLGAVQIRRGQVERGAWNLIYALLLTAVLRAVLRQSISLPFGILTAILSSAIGYFSLPPSQASRANILGYVIGGLIVIFDLYADRFFIRQVSPPDLVQGTNNLAILVVALLIVLIASQVRHLNIGARASTIFPLFSFIVIFIIGSLSISLVQNPLTHNSSQVSVDILQPILRSLRYWIVLLGALITAFAAILGTVLAGILAKPIRHLTEALAGLAKGDLSTRTVVETEDELGQLGSSFNEMAGRLENMVGQMETSAAERTRDLERRALQLQTAAEVSGAAARLLNLDQLLTRAARLISERFGFYHVGIFLLDEREEYAVLRATNSIGGQRMLARKHQLKVGAVGIVGYATGTGSPRIALDVGQDAVFFDNPDLPETRSEMALPLIAAGKTLGALDVQSKEGAAFQEGDVSTLQVLADQIAIAIENARLFEQNQATLEAVRRAYGELSQADWKRLQKSAETIGYISLAQKNIISVADADEAEPAPRSAADRPTVSDDGKTLFVPVKIRNQTIGLIRLTKPAHAASWLADEISAANALTDQISGAVESARLYRDAQRRAANERETAAIVNQIRSSTAIDTILQNTVRELGRSLGASRTFVQLTAATTDGAEKDSGDGQR